MTTHAMPAIHHFDHAIARAPAASVTQGLRAEDRGAPTLEGVRAEHDAYLAALRAEGVEVEVLPPLEGFPDAIFVEDPALAFPEAAILLRPGAASRLGEAAELAPALRRRFPRVIELAEGHADGGDVLALPGRALIGRSARTDAAGAGSLVAALAGLERAAEVVQTPPGVLHLKSDCALLDEETVLATARLAASGMFAGLRVLTTPEGEEAAANALRVNGAVLVGAHYPRTAALLSAAGYRVVPLAVAQIGLLDAGLSCMSLRWRSA